MMDNAKSDKINNKTEDQKNIRCSLCEQKDDILYEYYFKADGILIYEELCTECHNKVMNNNNIFFGNRYEKTTITGMRCMECGGKRNGNWFMTYDNVHKCTYIFCSKLCSVIRSRKSELDCHSCSKSCNTKQRFRCNGCGVAIYCSEICQKNDWINHKTICKVNAKVCRAAYIKANTKEVCHNCFKESTKGFKQCAGCKRVAYCSEVCQKAHWKSEHKIQCKELREQYPTKKE